MRRLTTLWLCALACSPKINHADPEPEPPALAKLVLDAGPARDATTIDASTDCPADACRRVGDQRIFRVTHSNNENGHDVCAQQGLSCVGAPVLEPPWAACVLFHPDLDISSDLNGWRQGVMCFNNEGLACAGNRACHHCPACNPGLDCDTRGSTYFEEMYVACAP